MSSYRHLMYSDRIIHSPLSCHHFITQSCHHIVISSYQQGDTHEAPRRHSGEVPRRAPGDQVTREVFDVKCAKTAVFYCGAGGCFAQTGATRTSPSPQPSLCTNVEPSSPRPSRERKPRPLTRTAGTPSAKSCLGNDSAEKLVLRFGIMHVNLGQAMRRT